MIPLEQHIDLEYQRRYGDASEHTTRAISRRRLRLRYELKLRCLDCGNVRMAGHSRCEKCFSKQTERYEKQYAKRKSNPSLCNRCGRPKDSESMAYHNCMACRDYNDTHFPERGMYKR